MIYVLQYTYKTFLYVGLLASVALVSACMTPRAAQAATAAELLQNMDRATLIELVSALRAEQAGTYVIEVDTENETDSGDDAAPAIDTSSVIAFEPGAKVRTTDNLRVRRGAGLRSGESGVQQRGAMGTIVQGPRNVDGYVWWKVDYDSGVDGWSVENWLRATEAAPADYSSSSNGGLFGGLGNGSGGNRAYPNGDDGGNFNGGSSSNGGGYSGGSSSGGNSSGNTISDPSPGSGVYR